MNRPSPLEIQDALFGATLRTVTYATAAIALVVLVSPWQAGPDGTAFTWDLWSGREVFYLLPVVAGVLLAVLGAIESVPGVALGGGAAVAGLVWMVACPDEFGPIFAAYGAGADGRETLAQVALPLLLGGLGWRLALRQSLAARVVVGLGVAGVIALFAVPMGDSGTTLFQAGVLDQISTGSTAAILAAAPLALTALGALASLAALLPSQPGRGSRSALSLAAFHVVLAAVAFGHVLPFASTLGDIPLTYAAFAVPLKLGALWWTGMLWLGLGAGVAGGAVEAMIQRTSPASSRPARPVGQVPGSSPATRPVLVGETFVPAKDLALPPPAAAAPEPLDLSPLPPPPGLDVFSGPLAAPVAAAAPDPAELIELSPRHALPLLETQDAALPAAPAVAARTSSPALSPSVPPPRPPSRPSLPAMPLPPPSRTSSPALPLQPLPPASAASSPVQPSSPSPSSQPVTGRRAPVHARTLLGAPAVLPVAAHTPSGMPTPGGSGRTGDTSLGVPAMRPRLPGGAPAPAPTPPGPPPEVSGLRFWPPGAGSAQPPTAPPPSETPVMGVEVGGSHPLRATPEAGTAVAGARPGRYQVVQAGSGPSPVPRDAAAGVRHHVSSLQRQLARGEITADEYQKRLDELLKAGRG
ncbi:MAG: SHOCT domain-containing protein [Deltaproteobacteria bacterium]|nr:SHOCT domain-containing protein [Deltaproteobacteria bacterium]